MSILKKEDDERKAVRAITNLFNNNRMFGGLDMDDRVNNKSQNEQLVNSMMRSGIKSNNSAVSGQR